MKTENTVVGKTVELSKVLVRDRMDDAEQRLADLFAMRDEVINTKEVTKENLRALLDFQRDDGSFSFISDCHIDSDMRELFIFRPTYAGCQILIMAFLTSNTRDKDAIKEALAKGLDFSCGRKLRGHGYNAMEHQLEDLGNFIDAGVVDFIKNHRSISRRFSSMIINIAREYRRKLVVLDTFGPWGEDYTMPMMKAVKNLGFDFRVPVFVYGTLMNGMHAHSLLGNSDYIGQGRAIGTALYELGEFPGMKITDDDSEVIGEVYRVDSDTFDRLHEYEGNGTLYDCKTLSVIVDDKKMRALGYIYKGEVNENDRIPEELLPYTKNSSLKDTHVWYVSYGSNMLLERFELYIKGGECKYNGRTYYGCTDKSMPLAMRNVTLPYELYFGNESPSWNGSGVAFIDLSKPGETLGRAYLITKEQFEEVWDQEGPSAWWYGELVDLGTIGGIPVRTFTNGSRHSSNKPTDAYRKVITDGITEAYPSINFDAKTIYINLAEMR